MTGLPSVLVVDDNDLDRRIIARALRLTGRFGTVIEAEHGGAALGLFADLDAARAAHGDDFPPGLVLLDINMPVMNGFEFLAAYEELAPPIDPPPFITMLTSSGASRDREQAERFGLVKDYLVKPLTVDLANELADQYLT